VQLAVVMLALFGQMDLTYAIARAAHARAVALAKGKKIGRPSVIDPAKLAYATRLRDQDDQSISEIVKVTGSTRSSLYRYLPPRRQRP
jgi:DNA invertase Pin-like site-specific DNA recombinase